MQCIFHKRERSRNRGFNLRSCGCFLRYRVTAYLVAIALVMALFKANSFFLRSSGLESSTSSCCIASESASSILDLLPRFIFIDKPGSEINSSTRPMYDSSCCLASNFLVKASSLVLNLAASSTICSISVLESLPTALEMVMFALRPEDFSVAVTLRIPLTSTSNTHSRAASPALIGGNGLKVNSPREVLSAHEDLSP